MKELSATIIAFSLITPPALAQECQPDQYGNIIDLGGGCISSEEVINNNGNNRQDIFSLIQTLGEMKANGFRAFFEYYKNQVMPAYMALGASIDPSTFVEDPFNFSRRVYIHDEAVYQIRSTLSPYTLSRGCSNGMRDRWDDKSDRSSTYIELLTILDQRIDIVDSYYKTGSFNAFNREVENKVLPLFSIAEKKLECLIEQGKITGNDETEAEQLLLERFTRFQQIFS